MDTQTSPPDSGPAALDHDSCYRALTARDARFDGVFFTGVKTTGIYCRPVCPAKTPGNASCTFFASAAAAENAGFRPCLRCRPELAPYAVQQNLAHAVWQRIAAGALNDGDVERLALEVGVSSRQLRRVLLQHFGVTPVELAQTQRLLFSKKLLQETQMSMADIAFASGFGSVRRFNALFAERYRMAPGDIRRAADKKPGTAGENAPQHLTLRLAYRPPLNWGQMLAYLSGRAIALVETVHLPPAGKDGAAADAGAGAVGAAAGAGAYLRSVRLGAAVGWMRVTQDEPRNQLIVELAPSLSGVLMPLLARVRNQFDLDANPGVIEAHLQQDALLAKQIAATPGIRVPGAFDPFELGLRAILGQQVSVAGATTLSGRLVQRFGEEIEPASRAPWPGLSHHFPQAATLAAADPADIALIGLPKTRAQTIANFAQFAAQGGLDMKPGSALLDVVEKMKTVRGIGDWTAHYIALRALRFPDAFPAGDLGLQKAAAVGEPPGEDGAAPRLTQKQLDVRALGWSPWRGYAALTLWHSLG